MPVLFLVASRRQVGNVTFGGPNSPVYFFRCLIFSPHFHYIMPISYFDAKLARSLHQPALCSKLKALTSPSQAGEKLNQFWLPISIPLKRLWVACLDHLSAPSSSKHRTPFLWFLHETFMSVWNHIGLRTRDVFQHQAEPADSQCASLCQYGFRLA